MLKSSSLGSALLCALVLQHGISHAQTTCKQPQFVPLTPEAQQLYGKLLSERKLTMAIQLPSDPKVLKDFSGKKTIDEKSLIDWLNWLKENPKARLAMSLGGKCMIAEDPYGCTPTSQPTDVLPIAKEKPNSSTPSPSDPNAKVPVMESCRANCNDPLKYGLRPKEKAECLAKCDSGK